MNVNHDNKGAYMNNTNDVIIQYGQIQQRAKQRLAEIDSEMADLSTRVQRLSAERDELSKVLGIKPIQTGARQARGLLPNACLNALLANPEGLTSSQVVEWISHHEPDVKPGSAPAILSRMLTNGLVKKSPMGYFTAV